MKVRPLHDRVLVQKIEPAEETAGGIILAERFQTNQVAVVLSVGEGRSYDGPGAVLETPGVKMDFPPTSYGELVGTVHKYLRQEPRLKRGDVVLFGIHSGTLVPIGDQEHFLLREDEVIGVAEDVEATAALTELPDPDVVGISLAESRKRTRALGDVKYAQHLVREVKRILG